MVDVVVVNVEVVEVVVVEVVVVKVVVVEVVVVVVEVVVVDGTEQFFSPETKASFDAKVLIRKHTSLFELPSA